MILFFDRNFGKTIPKVLQQIRRFPFEVHYHQEYFAQGELDDVWLPTVGEKDWLVVTQDYSYHKNQSEIDAIRHYKIGCFYLWGAKATQWEMFRCLVRAVDRMIQVAEESPKPFIYVVRKNSIVTALNIDDTDLGSKRPFPQPEQNPPRRSTK